MLEGQKPGELVNSQEADAQAKKAEQPVEQPPESPPRPELQPSAVESPAPTPELTQEQVEQLLGRNAREALKFGRELLLLKEQTLKPLRALVELAHQTEGSYLASGQTGALLRDALQQRLQDLIQAELNLNPDRQLRVLESEIVSDPAALRERDPEWTPTLEAAYRKALIEYHARKLHQIGSEPRNVTLLELNKPQDRNDQVFEAFDRTVVVKDSGVVLDRVSQDLMKEGQFLGLVRLARRYPQLRSVLESQEGATTAAREFADMLERTYWPGTQDEEALVAYQGRQGNQDFAKVFGNWHRRQQTRISAKEEQAEFLGYAKATGLDEAALAMHPALLRAVGERITSYLQPLPKLLERTQTYLERGSYQSGDVGRQVQVTMARLARQLVALPGPVRAEVMKSIDQTLLGQVQEGLRSYLSNLQLQAYDDTKLTSDVTEHEDPLALLGAEPLAAAEPAQPIVQPTPPPPAPEPPRMRTERFFEQDRKDKDPTAGNADRSDTTVGRV